MRIWAVIGLASWCGLGPGVPGIHQSSAAELTVFARTTLRIEVVSQGRRLYLRGDLRDNLFQGLADRPITVEVAPADGSLASVRRLEYPLHTDRNGQFLFRELLEEGSWVVSARYAGDRWHTPSSVEQMVRIQRVPLEIELVTPRAAPVWADIPVQVSVHSSGPRARWVIDLVINGVALGGPVVTDEEGRASLQVGTVNQEGVVGIEATFPGDDVYLPAAAQTRVQVYRSASIHLHTVQVYKGRDHRLLSVQGALQSDLGPIEGAELVLAIDGIEQEDAAITGRDGGFRFARSIADLEPRGLHEVAVLFHPLGSSDPELREEATTEIEISAGPLASLVVWARVAAGGLAAAAVLVFLALHVAMRLRPRRSNRRSSGPPGHGAPRKRVDLSIPPRRAGRQQVHVGGRVVDADTYLPIGPGEVVLERLDGGGGGKIAIGKEGSFEARDLEEGRYHATAQVTGYVATGFDLSIPHRGEFGQMEVYLASIRAWIRYLYQQMTEQLELGGEEEVWGRLTPRQVERLICESYLTGLPSAVEAEDVRRFRSRLREMLEQQGETAAEDRLRVLTLLVEEVYYSGRIYEEELIDRCHRLIAAVKGAVMAGRGRKGEEA
ncbi:MAG: Ig-like domain repeat protein [Bradymonadales bacterium]|nr:Ig-like domain repeat protein [Bradymonadales bacterium]